MDGTLNWSCSGSSNTSTLVASPLLPPADRYYGSTYDDGDHRYVKQRKSAWWVRICNSWKDRRSYFRRCDSIPAYYDTFELDDVEGGLVKNIVQPWPITCVFCFDDAVRVRQLDYKLYRNWGCFAELLLLWEDELGVCCSWPWDEVEEMEVRAGDWNARARPGWRIRIVCEAWYSDVDVDSESDSDGEGKGEEDMDDESWWEMEKSHKEKEWWFASWKGRVERRRGWMIGVVGMLMVFAAFWVIVLCT
jgi:hypothetical protein